MSTAVGVLRQRAAVGTAATKKEKSPETIRRHQAFYLVLLVGILGLAIVFMAAASANLRRLNNDLEAENAYIQAEIDSLEIKIGNASNINRIEKVATEKYGMVRADDESCISLGSEKTETTNLAATIKQEAYD